MKGVSNEMSSLKAGKLNLPVQRMKMFSYSQIIAESLQLALITTSNSPLNVGRSLGSEVLAGDRAGVA